ncbi:MAG: hypothetical protein ACOZIN_02970 [Myxococcota bacterium]
MKIGPRLLLFLLALFACQKKPAPASPQTEEACVDAYLAARGLDPFGNPQGTMYAGGTPLFDEKTGETKDRLELVYGKHPEAKSACGEMRPSP